MSSTTTSKTDRKSRELSLQKASIFARRVCSASKEVSKATSKLIHQDYPLWTQLQAYLKLSDVGPERRTEVISRNGDEYVVHEPFSMSFVAKMLCPIQTYFPSIRLKLVDINCIRATVYELPLTR